MGRRTPFGSMLVNFRFRKSEAIRKLKRDLLEKHKADNPRLKDEYEFRESEVHAQDGSTVIKVELWQRIDSERVKISTSVEAEILKDDTKVEEQDDDWGI